MDEWGALRAATVLGPGISQAGTEGTAALLAASDLVTVLDAHAPPAWAVWMLRAPGPAGSALVAVMEAFATAFRRNAADGQRPLRHHRARPRPADLPPEPD